MLRPAFAAPRPEMRSSDWSSGAHVLQREREDQCVELVLERRRAAGLVTIVAGKSEFLDHQRLAEALRNRDLPREIVAGVLLDRRPGAGQVLGVGPVPVLRADVRGYVIDRRRRMGVEGALVAFAAALRPLASGRHHMVAVYRLD